MNAQKKSAHVDQGVVILTPQDLGISAEAKKIVHPTAFALCVREYKQNNRQGTVGCKGRSDVAFANRKPWKQKGTGRARAGSARSPLWRKGGVIFGPQPRVRKLKVGQKIKQSVLASLLWNHLEQQRVHVLDFASSLERPATKQAYVALKQAQLGNTSLLLFLDGDDYVAYSSFVNMPQVRIQFFDTCHSLDVAQVKHVVILKKDIDKFKNMVMQWL